METGTDWQWQEGGEGDNGGKKGEGLFKEHVWMTHGHGQVWGLTVGVEGGLDGGGQRGKIRTTVIEYQYFLKRKNIYISMDQYKGSRSDLILYKTSWSKYLHLYEGN